MIWYDQETGVTFFLDCVKVVRDYVDSKDPEICFNITFGVVILCMKGNLKINNLSSITSKKF